MDTQQATALIKVNRQDLPVSCPPADAEVWAMHPRVYLPFEHETTATCAYCGATYQLVD